MSTNKFLEIGWEEWVALPELNVPAVRAKVDTGAKTSALHAFMVEKIYSDDDNDIKVRFGIHPVPNRPDIEIYCIAHLVDEREIISSNGQSELRYVIRTMAQFGKRKWPIEITLTDRETMAYRMLIGRSAMEGRLLVVPGASFLLGALSPDLYQNMPTRKHKKNLQICLLSSARNSYTVDRLVSAAENRQHKIEVIDTRRCYVDVNSTRPKIHYRGKVLPRFDAVIPRIGASMTFYGIAILRQFESLGLFSLNSAMGISHARDRLLAHQLLGRAGVAMPITAFAHYPGATRDMLRMVGGAPLMIKLLEGAQGKGVVLAPTEKAADAVMQTFRGLKANFLAQEYIKEPTRKDIRCIVLGRKVIAAMEVAPHTEQFTNRKLLERASTVKITVQEKNLVVKAARILGLKFAMVNFLRTRSGPKIIDVNATASLQTLERVTGLDIATMIIEYIESHARPRLVKRIVGHHH